MNTTLKIAAGVAAGVIAGTMLMGAAFATPPATGPLSQNGYRMMISGRRAGASRDVGVARMRDLMNAYRTPTGGIDMDRMHSDMVGGRIAPSGSGVGGSTGTSGQGYSMMGGTY